MALDINNFKEVGGSANFENGGQLYSVFSDTDTLATMSSDSYLDGLSNKLHMRDSILLGGTDGAQIVQVTNPNSPVMVSVIDAGNTGIAATLTGPGAIPITARSVDLSTIDSEAITLADGAIGQLLNITIVSIFDASSQAVITPDNFLGNSTIIMDDVGNSIQLEMKSGGWALIAEADMTNGISFF